MTKKTVKDPITDEEKVVMENDPSSALKREDASACTPSARAAA